jgi:hypothetical protein
MLIQVHWTNGSYNYVQDFMLDSLIEAGGVSRFLRSSGWVTVGVDRIRSSGSRRRYLGAERRLGLAELDDPEAAPELGLPCCA